MASIFVADIGGGGGQWPVVPVHLSSPRLMHWGAALSWLPDTTEGNGWSLPFWRPERGFR